MQLLSPDIASAEKIEAEIDEVYCEVQAGLDLIVEYISLQDAVLCF